MAWDILVKDMPSMVNLNEECELIAVCDILDKNVLEIEDINVPFYSSPEQMFEAEPNIEIVCVCTP